MKLTSAQIWDISADVFHNPKYRKEYVRLLSVIIGPKDRSILDTACGTGFPSIDLIKSGYKNMTCSDGDPGRVKMLKERLKKENLKIPVICDKWQAMRTDKKFDAVLNSDNSLVYMDSWSGGHIKRNAFKRLSLVLGNFYELLNKNGMLIVALAKNNAKENSELDINLGLTDRGEGVIWRLNFDWKNRIKTARMKVVAGGTTYERLI